MNLKDKGSMFFDNFKMQKEYTFSRMKSSLDSLKELMDNNEEAAQGFNAKDTLLLMYRTELSVLIPLAQYFSSMVELDYWQSETLQEALKIIWKV